LADKADRVADELKRRVDLMRDPRRELTDRLEPLRDASLQLELLALGLEADPCNRLRGQRRHPARDLQISAGEESDLAVREDQDRAVAQRDVQRGRDGLLDLVWLLAPLGYPRNVEHDRRLAGEYAPERPPALKRRAFERPGRGGDHAQFPAADRLEQGGMLKPKTRTQLHEPLLALLLERPLAVE